jgi:dTDP-4-amino-4,6-dideoxygalactose transaminase
MITPAAIIAAASSSVAGFFARIAPPTPVTYLSPLTPRIPFLDLDPGPELETELQAALTRVLASRRYLLGSELDAFEHEFADFCGAGHCVGVGSGLSAIELALRAAGIGRGDEVIVPAYTWVATWLAVTRAGAVPVGVDVLEDTYNIDPAAIEAAITSRSAAIVPVHLRGEPADMKAIAAIAEAHGLGVVEDAAQAHGARFAGRRVGGLGNTTAFSFYPSKNLGAMGDGGAVLTDDAELADRLRLLRNYGSRDRYRIEAEGTNSRLAEIQAAVLRVKLPRLEAGNKARATLAALYKRAFEGEESIAVPCTPAWAEPAWHLFAIGHPERDRCADALARQGIETLVHYPVLPHFSGAYRERGWQPGSFPVAERLAAAALSLPLYPRLSQQACESVSTAVLDTLTAGR